MAYNILGIFSAIILALTSIAAAAQEKQDSAANDVAAPLERPNSQTDARGAPVPANAAAQQRGSADRPNSAAGGSSDYFQAAQAAYKAALRKANSDHKTALAGCRALAKPEQKNCTDDADAHHKLAKTEAERLKPAS